MPFTVRLSVYSHKNAKEGFFFSGKQNFGSLCPNGQVPSKVNVGPCTSLNANSKFYWPFRTSNKLIGSTCLAKSLLVLKKILYQFTDKSYLYLFYFHLFQKHLGSFFGGNLLTRMSANVHWPCQTSRGLYLLAQSHLGGFLLVLGQRFTVSVEPCCIKN